MSTKYIASNWRLPNQENSSKSDNYGLSFNGSNELIDLGTSEVLFDSSKPFSCSTWCKVDSYSSPLYPALFLLKTDQSTGFVMFLSHTGTYAGITFGSSSNFLRKKVGDASDIPLNTWLNIVLTYDGVDRTAVLSYKVYINGVENTNIVDSDGIAACANENNIGGGNGVGTRFNGSISEVAIFDYALNSTQISTLYGSSELGSASPMALKPAPVAYYPLGDNSASNPLTQPNEAVEDASVFDFSSSFIDCGDSDDFSFTDGSNDLSYSFSAWVNADTLSTDLNQPNTIISKYGTSTNEWWFLIENKKLVIINYDQSNPTIIGRKYDTDLSANTWYHVVATYDGSKNVTGFKLYLDGVRVDDTNYNVNTTYGGMQNQVQNVFIGKRDRATRLSYFDGQINNTQIWQAELSASEVTTLYNSGVPLLTGTQPQASNLKAWYKLDQSANWEADSSGAWQIPDAVSAYPQSFNFDGDYIDCGQDTSLDTGDLSVSIWLNKDSTAFGTQYIFNNNNGSSPAGFAILMNNINKVFLYRKTTTHSANTGYTDVSFTTDTWHHLCFTYNDTTKAFVAYFNGVSFHTSTATSITGGASGNITIGTNSGLTGNNFIGKLSNAAIFNTALDSSQVETLYNNGTPLTTAIATDNLKAWYKLDNTATWTGSAYSIPDASGNGNTGTSSGMTEQNLVNNNVSVLNGESSGMTSANLVLSDLTRAVPYGDGYSFNFDSASSDYIDTTLDIDANSDFSISFWFNWNQNQKIIITDGSFDAWSSIGYGFQIMSNGSVSFLVGDSGASTGKTISSNAGSITANTWYHIVGVCDLSNEIRLYLNGTSVDSTSVGSSRNETSNNLRIAGDYSSSKRPFDGKISNISVFNESLTSTEVMKLYSNGVPQDLSNFTPQPQAWYPLGSNSFWNGSAWTVRDMIGSNDGTGQNIGIDGLAGDSPRSSANGVGTNNSIPENLVGTTKWSELNSWSINMSSEARVTDVP